jgi:flagellar biosynthesis/type III secretory pathway M-ring protein FliF/YscJ
MQWNFFSMLFVVGLALALGLVISNAELLQPATTKHNLDNIKIENERAQIAHDKEAERQDRLTVQALENAKQTSEKLDNLLQSFFNTINTSLIIITVAASIAFTAWAIRKNLIAYKMATLKANTHHIPSPAAQLARQMERANRSKEPQQKNTKKPNIIETLYTSPFWPEDDKQNHSNSKNYPLAS